jgi:hypothetical protein
MDRPKFCLCLLHRIGGRESLELEGSPEMAKSVSFGWPFVISGLKTLLETNKPLQVQAPTASSCA